MNKKICILILAVFIIGCASEVSELPEDTGMTNQQPLKLEFVREINVGEGAYSGIIFDNNNFFVHYKKYDGIYVKKYDPDFNQVGEELKLIGDEGPDHQMVFGDGFFYLVNAVNLRKFDSNFNEIRSVPYFDNLPNEEKEKWARGVDDMLLYYGGGSVYLGIASGKSPSPPDGEKEWTGGEKPEGDLIDTGKAEKKQDIPGGIFFQRYDRNLELKSQFLIDDLGNTPASSMLLQDGTYTIVCADRHWDDSSLIAVSYDSNWNFIDRKIISAVPDANEEFVMGLLFKEGIYFVSYHHLIGDLSQPMGGELILRGDVMLKAFDEDWNLLGEVMPSKGMSGGPAASPHIALSENMIYVAYTIIDPSSANVVVKGYRLVTVPK